MGYSVNVGKTKVGLDEVQFSVSEQEFLTVTQYEGHFTLLWPSEILPTRFLQGTINGLKLLREEAVVYRWERGQNEFAAVPSLLNDAKSNELRFDRDCAFLRISFVHFDLAYHALEPFAAAMPSFGSGDQTAAIGVSATTREPEAMSDIGFAISHTATEGVVAVQDSMLEVVDSYLLMWGIKG